MSLAGTLPFIPPEQSTGKEADLYAVGKLLYCMITGLSPDDFPTIPPNLMTPEIKKLNRVIVKACAKNPAKRYVSVREVRDAITDNNILPVRSLIIMGIIIILLICIVIFFIIFFT